MRLPDVEAVFAKRNPRRHNVKAIAESILENGFNAFPAVNEKDGRLVVGHGRTKALRWLFEKDPEALPARIARDEDGEWLMPVLRGMSFKGREEAERYLLSDNRVAELSRWDEQKLAGILERLRQRGKLSGTGFSDRRVSSLLARVRKRSEIDSKPRLHGLTYKVLVECEDDQDQATLIEKLESEGRKCRPLIS